MQNSPTCPIYIIVKVKIEYEYTESTYQLPQIRNTDQRQSCRHLTGAHTEISYQGRIEFGRENWHHHIRRSNCELPDHETRNHDPVVVERYREQFTRNASQSANKHADKNRDLSASFQQYWYANSDRWYFYYGEYDGCDVQVAQVEIPDVQQKSVVGNRHRKPREEQTECSFEKGAFEQHENAGLFGLTLGLAQNQQFIYVVWYLTLVKFRRLNNYVFGLLDPASAY